MKKRGFTLIEVLASLSLVIFLAAGTAELISLSLIVERKAEIHGQLMRLLTEKLERLRSLAPDNEALKPGDYHEVVRAENGSRSFLREWQIEDLPGELKRVEIKISTMGQNRSILSAMLFISKKWGF